MCPDVPVKFWRYINWYLLTFFHTTYYCTVPGDSTDGGDVSVVLASTEQPSTSAALAAEHPVAVEVDERTGSTQVFQLRSIEDVIPAEAISGVCEQGQQHHENDQSSVEPDGSAGGLASTMQAHAEGQSSTATTQSPSTSLSFSDRMPAPHSSKANVKRKRKMGHSDT